MKKTIPLVALAVVVVVAIFGLVAKNNIETNLKQLTHLPIPEIDLSQIVDGVYTGSYEVFPVSAEVEVTIKNHTITEIDLVKHNHGQGAGAETIPGSVVEAQSLQVDIVSGATYSSKVILKAIEQALTTKGK